MRTIAEARSLQTWPAALLAGSGLVIAGVARWNHRVMAALVREIDASPRIVASIDEGIERARRERRTLLAWAAKFTPAHERRAVEAGIDVVRIEDGFLRSVGLGAGLVPGACFAIDGRGIHYDATRPSDLECDLAHAEISPAEQQRGSRLAALIAGNRLSKYNLGGAQTRLPMTTARERILVPGQVADDAAVRHTLSGSLDLSGGNVNIALLRAVRQRNPTAFITYKPHPDVTRGLRPGGIATDDVRRLADMELPDADILDLIAQCDRVETLSSLTGFEALIRGKPVTVHGAPFYAGWGLTEDLTAMPRRGRRRTFGELVYLSLVRYCRAIDPETLEPLSCERLIERLSEFKARRPRRALSAARFSLSWVGHKLGL
jgi:capsule polysaccharide export protein KpsC/LpsZ